MKSRDLLIACVVALAASVGTPDVKQSGSSEPRLTFGVQQAEAAPRNVARRTARRTTRRTVRRLTVLPAGCAWRAPYHYCGGVYYQSVVENGATVYVVVTP